VEGEQAKEVMASIQANLERSEQLNQELRLKLESTQQQFLQEQARAESLAALITSQEIVPDSTLSPGVETTVSGVTSPHAREADGVEYPESSVISGEQAEVIASMTQELRQPMSSIVGYTDLLLGESVGILGALQRKFLERVKASTERMGGLVDDIIQMSTLGNSTVKLSPESVDLNALIDEAIAMTIAQVREKNIALRVDIPAAIPPMMADRDAMQQILVHLLQNAEAATPADGEISLGATLHEGTKEEKSKGDYLLLKVSDSGGGIPAEDLPRVFSRLYRADSALIQGVGDTGVGLAVVKALVEAHCGRIWVDAEIGRGSTFSVLLPFVPCPEEGTGAGGPPA
jgi:signal transduction histidine kinase